MVTFSFLHLLSMRQISFILTIFKTKIEQTKTHKKSIHYTSKHFRRPYNAWKIRKEILKNLYKKTTTKNPHPNQTNKTFNRKSSSKLYRGKWNRQESLKDLKRKLRHKETSRCKTDLCAVYVRLPSEVEGMLLSMDWTVSLKDPAPDWLLQSTVVPRAIQL